MNRTNILLLEDNVDRINGFTAAVKELGAPYRLVCWKDANQFISECHESLADAALISLDHDLNKESDQSPDPGDGLAVAGFLARLPAICPVILHTSNNERVWSMANEFRFGGWQAERVIPLSTDWIEKSWTPTARVLLEKISTNENDYFRPHKSTDQSERISRTLLSLYGLAIGDGIGEMMFSRPSSAYEMITQSSLAAGPWWHTDDTEMAISIVETLRLLGSVHQASLAKQFAWRYELGPDRGYGSGARQQLRMLIGGADWRELSREAFGGTSASFVGDQPGPRSLQAKAFKATRSSSPLRRSPPAGTYQQTRQHVAPLPAGGSGASDGAQPSGMAQ